jgi:2-polyprenyl-6-methoxyphenol hydroxylase-like FAD-dependent oxidoreductase
MEQRQVLIVGAGPTGLVLALWLSRFGVTVRIIDKAPAAGTTSRAMVVHARCLEFYRQLGIAEAVIEAGEKATLLDGHLDRKLIARIPFGDFGEGLSRYPFMLVLPQDVHEHLLEDELKRAGVSVERNCELLDFEQTTDHVLARLGTARGEDNARFEYLCGCDGAHSSVREKCGISFPGGTYEQVFFVADAVVTGRMADDNVHFAFTDREMLGVFPLKRRESWRLIGIVPRNVTKDVHAIGYDDVADQVRHTTGLEALRVNWFSTYHVHHRVAGEFRKGRAFLLGDAAHIHSPAGGQGMNTGIGDASNLGWKLVAVLQGRAAATLLESYPAERIAIAYRIVRSTDRIFSFQVSPSWAMRMARRWLIPLIPALMRIGAVRRTMFRAISQIAFAYRESPISAGAAGRVRGGDRLPWFRLADGVDDHESLGDLDWQVHVYSEAPKSLEMCCMKRGLRLRQFPWSRAARAAGLEQRALYLLRPDGHVGFAAPKDEVAALEHYLSRLGIRARARA